MSHEKYMAIALEEAKKAFEIDEVPIGAVAVYKGEVIARAHNEKELLQDPTAHAEILCIKKACEHLQQWRLTGVTLYVTIEPCLMCMGALSHSRVERLVFGSRDPKFGAARSLYLVAEDERLNHRFAVEEGILQKECAQIMTDFFKRKRTKER